MTRLNQILIGVLIVQLVVAAFVFLPRTLSSQTEVEALLPGLDVDGVTALTITSGWQNVADVLDRIEGDLLRFAQKDPRRKSPSTYQCLLQAGA